MRSLPVRLLTPRSCVRALCSKAVTKIDVFRQDVYMPAHIRYRWERSLKAQPLLMVRQSALRRANLHRSTGVDVQYLYPVCAVSSLVDSVRSNTYNDRYPSGRHPGGTHCQAQRYMREN